MKKQLFSIKNLLMASTIVLSGGSTFAQTTVYDVIAASPDHTYLTAALDQEGLDAVLDMNTSQYTVFAPDNAAFDQLIIDLGLTDINDVLALTDLSNILQYHVLSGSVPSSNVSNGQIVTPLHDDNTLKLTINGTSVFANQAEVNGIDLTGSNGYVHSINSVLLDSETVADIAIDSPNHTTLVAAVIEARLLPALTNPFSELTVFAPTDAAFTEALAALNISAADLLASPDLSDILLYHVLGEEVLSTSLSNGMIAEPLSTTNTLKVTIDGADVFVNQAQVTVPNVQAGNGAVHVLDGVVLPNETVADIAIDSPDHTTLVAAVIEARLLPALTNPFSELTVFAPTDAAFTEALAALNISAADLLASPDLTDILLYHVLGEEVLSTSLSNGMIAEPLSTTNTLKVTIDGADVFVNQAQVTVPNVQAGNGAVHVLDGVVLPNETVADIAIDSPDHTTLVAAVIEARLLPALTNPFSELTVFAPTDAAFTEALAALNISAADLLASPDLSDILLYHVLGEEVLSTSLSNGMIAEPLSTTNTLKVTIDGADVFVNQAQVTVPNVQAGNGAVHVLDGVVLPNETVADIAIDSPDHTTLVAAVIEARLLPALTNPFSELTVFAPTDAAFTEALAALNISAADLLASPDLTDILLYHVVGSDVPSSALTNGPVATLNGQDIVVDLSAGVMINDANVTTPDLFAGNGTVHVIDGVLLPNLTTSIQEKNNLDLLVYPNPAVNVLNIALNSNELFNLTITDLNGKQILAERISNISNMVDISNLSSGMYLLRIANSNAQSTTKIQIAK